MKKSYHSRLVPTRLATTVLVSVELGIAVFPVLLGEGSVITFSVVFLRSIGANRVDRIKSANFPPFQASGSAKAFWSRVAAQFSMLCRRFRKVQRSAVR